jgi:hypothetical protein
MDPEVKAMLLAASPKAAERLIEALDAERAVVVPGGRDAAHVEMVPDFDMRIKAANAVLDRLFGKPKQPITGEEGAPPVSVDLASLLERLAGQVSKSLLQRAIERVGVEGVLEALPPRAREQLRYDWRAWARPEQLAPTACGGVAHPRRPRLRKDAHRRRVVRGECRAGRRGRIALVAPTASDARDVMVEGESGHAGDLAAMVPADVRALEAPPHVAQRRRGDAVLGRRARAPPRSAARRRVVRRAGSWRYPDAWDMLQFGLRLGNDPRALVTARPSR